MIEPQQILFELTTALDFVNDMPRLWKTGSAENRQILARSLFEYLVYDLDARQITDFRLKPWAERFLSLRLELFRSQNDSGETRGAALLLDLLYGRR